MPHDMEDPDLVTILARRGIDPAQRQQLADLIRRLIEDRLAGRQPGGTPPIIPTAEAAGILDGLFGGNKGGAGKIGLDKFLKLAQLLPLLQEVQAAAAGDLATVEGMTALLNAVVKLAEAGVALTPDAKDDELLASVKKFLLDPNAAALLAKLYAGYARKRTSGDVFAMAGEETGEFTALGFDPALLLQLLPLLLELVNAFKGRKPA